MREIGIERLLQWAYRDELPKRGIGDVANSYEPVIRFGELLTVIDDEPGYPVIMGPPHPDALTIERAVQGLKPELCLEWNEYRLLLMGDMHALAPARDPLAMPDTVQGIAAKVSKDQRGARTDRHQVEVPRVVFSEVALIEHCARMGRRPDWNAGTPRPRRRLGLNRKPVLIGECHGPARYALGSHCPLDYVDPTIEQLVVRRAEYLIWRGALERLVGVLKAWTLQAHVPQMPDAPATPWLDAPAPARPAAIPGTLPWRTWPDEKPKRRRRTNAEGRAVVPDRA